MPDKSKRDARWHPPLFATTDPRFNKIDVHITQEAILFIFLLNSLLLVPKKYASYIWQLIAFVVKRKRTVTIAPEELILLYFSKGWKRCHYHT